MRCWVSYPAACYRNVRQLCSPAGDRAASCRCCWRKCRLQSKCFPHAGRTLPSGSARRTTHMLKPTSATPARTEQAIPSVAAAPPARRGSNSSMVLPWASRLGSPTSVILNLPLIWSDVLPNRTRAFAPLARALALSLSLAFNLRLKDL